MTCVTESGAGVEEVAACATGGGRVCRKAKGREDDRPRGMYGTYESMSSVMVATNDGK